MQFSTNTDYVDEEGRLAYGYPKSFLDQDGYPKPNAVSVQIDLLRVRWPHLNPDRALAFHAGAYQRLFPSRASDWVEGPYVLLRPGLFGGTYIDDAKEAIIGLKATCRRSFHWGPVFDNKCRLRQTAVSQELIARAQSCQEGDFILIPGQAGIRFGACSPRRAVVKAGQDEACLGFYSGAAIAIGNPHRFGPDHNECGMDLSGDVYAPDEEGVFSAAPVLYVGHDGTLNSYWRPLNCSYGVFGSASGRFPSK